MKKSVIVIFTIMTCCFIWGCSESPVQINEKKTTEEPIVGMMNEASNLPDGQFLVVTCDENGQEIKREVITIEEKGGTSLAKASKTGTHYYITPCVSPVENSNGRGCLGITAAHANTAIYFRGTYLGLMGSGNTKYIGAGNFPGGSSLRTTNEVQASVWHDGPNYTRGFSLLPKRQWGKYYRVPRLSPLSSDSRVYATVATLDYGHVTIGGNGIWMGPGEHRVFNVPQGAAITADMPVFCTSWIDSHGYCRGVTLDPID